MLQGLHHVAYRCRDAAETVDFYTRVLGLPFAHALSNDTVASIGEYSPHIHIFFEMHDGSYIAFFEVPISPPSQRDPNAPQWVQHLALEVADEQTLLSSKARLEACGVSVVGPTDHGFCLSIYFFDPNGHRLEMTLKTEAKGDRSRYAAQAPDVLRNWLERKARGDFHAKHGQAGVAQ